MVTEYKDIIVAFDINGTLLKRFHRYDKKEHRSIIDYREPVVIYNHFVYYRPYLKELSEFLDSYNIGYVFWSTMYEHNIRLYVKSLESFGFNKYLGCYNESHCKIGKERGQIKAERWMKDLRLLSELHKTSLSNCVLVDDNILKSAEGCNFIPIKEYNPSESDEEILRLIDKLREFINTR